MTDLLTEMSKVKSLNPAMPDEVVIKFAKTRIANVKDDDEKAVRLAAEAWEAAFAKMTWWARMTQPRLWPVWLLLQIYIWFRRRQKEAGKPQ